MTKSLLTLAVFVFTSTAYAKINCRDANAMETAAISEPARRVLQLAMQNGLNEFDGFHLRNISNSIKDVKVCVADRIQVENRTTALWIAKEKGELYRKIAYDKELFPKFDYKVREILAVHEYLGAISGGWKDDGYSHAFYIYMWAQKRAFQPLLNLFSWPQKLGRPILEARGGGTTTVGGGGDGRDVEMKLNTLFVILDLVETKKTLFDGLKAPQVPLGEMIRGVVFVNWYVDSTVRKDHAKVHNPDDKSIAPTFLLRPEDYDLFVRLIPIGVEAVLKMAETYALKTL